MSASDSGQHGRFLPGTMVADRYRIVGLLGRGGMGEVYRADDLKLGQQVALKFLPGAMVADDDQVRRLFDEVRMARKVSHPNVCRVFDVAEIDGQHYVSMEYVDGEDLSSLLRRIGRLPEDKAVEIARQLCAALAAAHDEGVLHRDLKPANIMLDGRGRVKLTDFGLAAVAEVRAGTPIYMAPEQLAGTEVSVKSDIYSLGLVLHELFTGKRVFEANDFNELSRLHNEVMTTSFTSTSQLDAAVDRTIHRCLEKDPAKRPGSALAVAAGLPGADPLAAALAAGETPSPEMVAEAGGKGSLSLLTASALLVFTLGCAIAVGFVQSQRSVISWVPFEMSPDDLGERAEEVLETLGYSLDFGDTASALQTDWTALHWLRLQDATAEQLAIVTSGRSGSIKFWWRGSPTTLVPTDSMGSRLATAVALDNPPRTTPGMVALMLDASGRLLWLDAAPDRLGTAASAPPATNWESLFELMGLRLAEFQRVEPRLTPAHFADERVAWEGAFPEAPQSPIRVEAAAYEGRPSSLRIFTESNPLEETTARAAAQMSGFAAVTAAAIGLTIVGLIVTVIFGGLYVARRNVLSGRGDARGARRLGFAMAITIGFSWLLSEHTATPEDVNAFIEMLIFVAATGGLTWALYLAVEPFMRRHAPESLIGWTRFLDGRWSDPLVARDLLLGCAAGALSRLFDTLPMVFSPRIATAENNLTLPLTAPSAVVESIIGNATGYLIVGLALAFLYSLSFIAFRRRFWVAYGAWLFVLGGIGFIPGLTINAGRPAATLLSSVFWALAWALWLYVLFRLGLLVFLAMSTTAGMLAVTLPTLDFSSWYASSMLTGMAVLTALVVYCFWRSVPWKGGLADALVGD
jgi:serine/threonine-protein kinase